MSRTPHLDEMIKDRQHERRSLAGSSLRATYHISAGKQLRDRLLLNRRRRTISGVKDRMLKFLIKATEYVSFEHSR